MPRASFITDETQTAKVSPHPEKPSRDRGETERQEKEAKSAKGVEVTESDSWEAEIDWPQTREKNAALQVPSFKRVGPLVSHGGSPLQKKRLPKVLVREKKDPSRHVEKSSKAVSPLGAKARAPQDELEVVRFFAGHESNAIKAFWGSGMEQPKQRAFRRAKAMARWGKFPAA